MKKTRGFTPTPKIFGVSSQSERGFTLIELLVVIAIIGILSSVVLASLNSARTKARDAKRISDMKQLQLSLEMYYDDNTSYPLADTYTLLVSGNELSDYLATMPNDAENSYTYISETPGTTYCLGMTVEGAGGLDGDTNCSIADDGTDPKIYTTSP